MLSERDLIKLEEKSKKQLLEILKLVCRKNMNANELIHNFLNNKKSNPKKMKKDIIKIIDDPTSDYAVLYILVRNFIETSVSDEDALDLGVESASRFIDELVAYNYMHPEELMHITMEVYDLALSYASYLKHLDAARKLYDMIPHHLDAFGLAFIELFDMYFRVDEEDNITFEGDQ
jgi:hypothetical protein